MKIKGISAITIFTKNMKAACSFYSRIPTFELIFGGESSDFSTFQVSNSPKMYLNLELSLDHSGCYFGRIIFHTGDVDALFSHLKNDKIISNLAKFETEPTDAPWNERFFHIRDPDGYQLSFATPLSN